MEAAFLKRGVEAEEAFALASTGVVAIADLHGGRQFYLPRGDALRIALRDAQIFRLAHRGNIEHLAADHSLTVSQIYRIIRTQQALHIRKVQGRLPFSDSEA